MAEKLVLVGMFPDTVVIEPGDQMVWHSLSGNLRIEFDANRSPFSSNVFQAPTGVNILSGPPRTAINPGSYKYRVWLNDQHIADGEVVVRPKQP
jgi:hypothetical protein